MSHLIYILVVAALASYHTKKTDPNQSYVVKIENLTHLNLRMNAPVLNPPGNLMALNPAHRQPCNNCDIAVCAPLT